MIKYTAIAIGSAAVIFLAIFFISPMRYHIKYTDASDETTSKPAETVKADAAALENGITHIKTPEHVRALYLSSWGASSTKLRSQVIGLTEDSKLLNAVVIDIKDATGKISYVPPRAELEAYKTYEKRISDIIPFIKSLHEKGIYVIGRISVFQDPYYAELHPEDAYKTISNPTATWKDHKGLAFIRVDAENYWKYIALIADVSYRDIGFDEINFDYVRYPSDGNMKDLNYQIPEGKKRADILVEFFSYLKNTLDPNIVRSADVFGLVISSEDDLGIGQKFERILPYLDYVGPMIYPSHYPSGFHGYAKPATVPYEIISIATKDMIKKVTKMHTTTEAAPAPVPNADGTIPPAPAPVVHVDQEAIKADIAKYRPWLQDFDLGAPYGVAEVHAQMKALLENGIQDFMIWDASNKYTPEAYLTLDGLSFTL